MNEILTKEIYLQEYIEFVRLYKEGKDYRKIYLNKLINSALEINDTQTIIKVKVLQSINIDLKYFE